MAEIALNVQVETRRLTPDVSIAVGTNSRDLELAVSRGSGVAPEDYSGSYTVVSSLYDNTTMQTKNKRMTDDVTIRPIPIHAVENPSGGMTVTIGE